MGSSPESSLRLALHWRANLRLIATLAVTWLVVAFGSAYFAPVLSTVTVLGWPLGFYMCAQGSLLVFILLVAIYARKMAKIDRQYGMDEDSP